MALPGSISTFPDPDPDPTKWYGSDRIRIRNTALNHTLLQLYYSVTQSLLQLYYSVTHSLLQLYYSVTHSLLQIYYSVTHLLQLYYSVIHLLQLYYSVIQPLLITLIALSFNLCHCICVMVYVVRKFLMISKSSFCLLRSSKAEKRPTPQR